MVALYACDARLAARLVALWPAAARVAAATDWATFLRDVAAADCAVVCGDWLADPLVLGHLAELRARAPLRPIVLVTRRDADNARHLKDVSVDEVVWHGEAAWALWPAVGRARASGALHRLAGAVERAPGIAPPLRRALAHACRSARPVTTVARLAAAAGCDRRTLWRQWRMAHVGRPARSLLDVLHGLLLVRALAVRQGSGDAAAGGWHAVAEALGVHEHTLARSAHALTGEGLRELAARRAEDVLVEFAAEALSTFAAPDAAPASAFARGPVGQNGPE